MFFVCFFFQSFLFTINCLSVSHNLLLWWFTVMKGNYYSSKGSTFSLTLSYVFIGRSYVFLQTTSDTRRKVVGDISFPNLLCNMTHQAAYRHILQNRSQPFIRFSDTVFQLGIPPFTSNIILCITARYNFVKPFADRVSQSRWLKALLLHDLHVKLLHIKGHWF